jgi:hypothetical protein
MANPKKKSEKIIKDSVYPKAGDKKLYTSKGFTTNDVHQMGIRKVKEDFFPELLDERETLDQLPKNIFDSFFWNPKPGDEFIIQEGDDLASGRKIKKKFSDVEPDLSKLRYVKRVKWQDPITHKDFSPAWTGGFSVERVDDPNIVYHFVLDQNSAWFQKWKLEHERHNVQEQNKRTQKYHADVKRVGDRKRILDELADRIIEGKVEKEKESLSEIDEKIKIKKEKLLIEFSKFDNQLKALAEQLKKSPSKKLESQYQKIKTEGMKVVSELTGLGHLFGKLNW